MLRLSLSILLVIAVFFSCSLDSYKAIVEFSDVHLISSGDMYGHRLVDVSISVTNTGSGKSAVSEVFITINNGSESADVISVPFLFPQIDVGERYTETYRVLIPRTVCGESDLVFRLEHLGKEADVATILIDVQPVPGEIEVNDDRTQAFLVDFNQGYYGSISTADTDWYCVTLDPGKELGTSVDGDLGNMVLEFFLNDETTSFDYLNSDAFALGFTYENISEDPVVVYVKATCGYTQDYWIIFEEIK